MEKVKKVFKVLAFIFFILLASMGLGIAQVFTPSREKYLDTAIKIEHVDKKENDGDMEIKDVN
jgi:hypothetical protein